MTRWVIRVCERMIHMNHVTHACFLSHDSCVLSRKIRNEPTQRKWGTVSGPAGSIGQNPRNNYATLLTYATHSAALKGHVAWTSTCIDPHIDPAVNKKFARIKMHFCAFRKVCIHFFCKWKVPDGERSAFSPAEYNVDLRLAQKSTCMTVLFYSLIVGFIV